VRINAATIFWKVRQLGGRGSRGARHIEWRRKKLNDGIGLCRQSKFEIRVPTFELGYTGLMRVYLLMTFFHVPCACGISTRNNVLRIELCLI